MLFGKKSGNGLFREVDDSRQVVYDFRTRTDQLFSNYRAISYKKQASYDLESLKIENAEMLEKLMVSKSVDAGNEDCLVDKILGPVRNEIRYLDDQALEHSDFYIRQGVNMAAHVSDIERILTLWKAKEVAMSKEHQYTQMLWDRYCGNCNKEVEKDEE